MASSNFDLLPFFCSPSSSSSCLFLLVMGLLLVSADRFLERKSVIYKSPSANITEHREFSCTVARSKGDIL